MVAKAGGRSTQLDALSVCVQARVPCLLWGDPGVGKTATVQQLAETLGMRLETVIASIREPTDFAGLPFVARRMVVKNKGLIVRLLAKKLDLSEEEIEANLADLLNFVGVPTVSGGVVVFAPPQWAKNLIDSKGGIAFFDELSTARPAVQTALLRVVLERVVGDTELPEGTAIIAAANLPDQIAGGWDLTAPLANRFVHLNWKLEPARWVEGFTYGWPKPQIVKVRDSWRDELELIRPVIGGFITSRPELLHHMPPTETQRGQAWPSPRTWVMGSELLAACEATPLDADAKRELQIVLLTGAVGGAALEFMQYRDNLDLPDPEELLGNPEAAKLPERDDRLFAALASVVYVVSKNRTPDRWHRAWRVLQRATENRPKDVAMAHAYHLARCRPQGAAAPSLQVFRDAMVAAGILTKAS